MARRAAERDLSGLQRRVGHTFSDPALLRRAITHRSYAADHNERLEFIGDSLLNCVVAILLGLSTLLLAAWLVRREDPEDVSDQAPRIP